MQNITDEKLSVLANHYQTSVQNLKDDIKTRDWYFSLVLFIFVCILTRIVDLSTFTIIFDKATTLHTSKLEKNVYLRCAIWSSCFYFFMRYAQKHITIERSYNYIKILEKELSSHFDNKVFTLESLFYKHDRFLTKKINTITFKKIIPFLMLLILALQLHYIF
ncbi:hypothetical protein, partial [Aeromonas veronii]|uniref:hypothetical protein n=1 Tax=Aeromonas veronii TaxID=654 RepID=UPI001C57F0D1